MSNTGSAESRSRTWREGGEGRRGGGTEGGREGGREGGTEGGREGGREGGKREGRMRVFHTSTSICTSSHGSEESSGGLAAFSIALNDASFLRCCTAIQ